MNFFQVNKNYVRNSNIFGMHNAFTELFYVSTFIVQLDK
ncbi:hypothetical protein DFP78_106166 [Photobacterium lutimaris]|nr:hypothetical protein DFP78_106166 [Photobacterium lutimaris]